MQGRLSQGAVGSLSTRLDSVELRVLVMWGLSGNSLATNREGGGECISLRELSDSSRFGVFLSGVRCPSWNCAGSIIYILSVCVVESFAALARAFIEIAIAARA